MIVEEPKPEPQKCPFCDGDDQDEKKCSCGGWCGKEWCPSAPQSDDEEYDDDKLDEDDGWEEDIEF